MENWLEESTKFLDSVGMYSIDKAKLLRMKFSIIFLIILLTAGFFDFLLNCKTLDNYLDGLTSFLPTLFSVIYLSCFVSNQDIMHEIVGIIRENFVYQTHSIEAENLGRKLVKYARIFNVFVIIGYALMAVIALYSEKSEGNIHDGKANGLPARAYIPLNMEKLYWYITFLLFEVACTFITANTTIPMAIFFATLLIHLRGQLYYLQERLLLVSELEDPKQQRALLNECLELHMLLIHFTERMQEGYASILAIHNYSPEMVISVVAYQASLSEEIGFVAYSTKWYNSPPDIGRDLQLLTLRSQRSLRLNLIASTDASLETYHDIVMNGYSYFMFLSGMNPPDEE